MDAMSFQGFFFPYNPRRLEIGQLRNVKVYSMPFSSPVLQELGVRPRTIQGEGEWFGADCLAQFEALRQVFAQGGSGRLSCPLCAPMYAYFTSLRVIGESGPKLLRYAFEFVEDMERTQGRAQKAVSL